MKHLLLTTIAAVLLVGCGPSIHQVAKDGDIEAVKQAIADGADVNAKMDNGRTALHYAAQEGHKEIVEMLIAKGADVNAKFDAGWTSLHFVATKEIAELLIAAGADVNAKDDRGDTSLNWANRAARTELADLIRKHGGKTKKELEAATK